MSASTTTATFVSYHLNDGAISSGEANKMMSSVLIRKKEEEEQQLQLAYVSSAKLRQEIEHEEKQEYHDQLNASSTTIGATTATLTTRMVDDDNNKNESEQRHVYQYVVQKSSSDTPPPVKVVDLSCAGKGNGLIATRNIQQGETLYTEKAAIVIQQPSVYATFPASSCQYCFKSLETPMTTGFQDLPNVDQWWPNPEYDKDDHDFYRILTTTQFNLIATHTPSDEDNNGSGSDSDSDDHDNDDYERKEEQQQQQYVKDRFDRIICTCCNCMFCSTECKEAFTHEIIPSCCTYYNKIIHAFDNIHCDNNKVYRYTDSQVQQNAYSFPTNKKNRSLEKETVSNWSLLLAARAFSMILLKFRTTSNNDNEKGFQNNYFDTSMIDGMCGNAEDIDPLGLGIVIQQQQQQHGNNREESKKNIDKKEEKRKKQYTVKSFYDSLCEILLIQQNSTEKDFFTLELYSRLASICQRNTYTFGTKPPYNAYEENMKKYTRCNNNNLPVKGDNSSSTDSTSTNNRSNKKGEEFDYDYNKLKSKVASVLSTHDCGYDACESGTIRCSAVFPLSSRMNHSCIPNVEFVDEEHYDCCANLVAIRDIEIGEELTTSYLSDETQKRYDESHKGTKQRIDHLDRNYFFICSCPKCSNK